MVTTASETAEYQPPPRREQLQAVLLAALCSVVFLGKALWPGYAVMPYPPEVLEPNRTEALAEGRVTLDDLSVGNPSFGDKYNQSLTWDRVLGDRMQEGVVPRWTRDISGGAALVPQACQPYQPWSWMTGLISTPGIYGPWFLLHQVLFSFFAYRFLRRIGVCHLSGLLGVVCVSVGLWTQARVHHNVFLTSALPLFAMMSCVHEIGVRRGGARAATWLALGAGLSWLSGMPHIALLVSYVVGAYACVVVAGRAAGDRLRPLLWIGGAFAVGALLSSAQMIAVIVAVQDTSRAVPTLHDLAIRRLEWDHALTGVWPDLLNWPAEKWYPSVGPEVNYPPWVALLLLGWDRVNAGVYSYTETAFAIGLPALVLVVCALTGRVRRRETWFFMVVALLSFLMATAFEPLFSLLAAVPGAHSADIKRYVFPCAMALSVLAALGMDRVLRGRVPWYGFGFAGVIAAASAVLAFMHWVPPDELARNYSEWVTAGRDDVTAGDFRAAVLPGMAEATRSHLLTTFVRALVLAVLTIGLLAWRRIWFAPLLLIALTAGDLLWTGHGTVVAIESERITTPPRILEPALAATREAKGPRPRFQGLNMSAPAPREGGLMRPNLASFFGLEDMASYNPLPSRRMEELFAALEPGMELGGNGVGRFKQVASLTHPLVDLLGIEWILTDGELDLPGHEDRTPANYAHRFRLYRRTTCLPRATFVTGTRLIEDRDQRLAELANRERDFRSEVLLEDPAAPTLDTATASDAAVSFVSSRDEVVELAVTNSVAGYLRLADPWNAGWIATVDGAPAPVYVADHYLRAVFLDPGEHEVVFSYGAPVAVWPGRLSALGLLLILCALAWRPWSRRR